MNASDIPRPTSIAYFERAIQEHKKVINLSKLENYYYSIDLCNGRSYKVIITNIYTVGIADVEEFSSNFDIDAIVTISTWNGYTFEAKEYSQMIGKGLFVIKELMGALNFDKPEEYFSEYVDGKKTYLGVR